MENKGLVKLFALLFGLVSIYQISFTFKGSQIEKQALEYATNKVSDTETDYDALRTNAQKEYLDSLENVDVYNIGISKYTYKDVKEKAMNLGLDLKGGIDATLQISVKDILRGLSNNSEDPIFNQALANADELQKNAQESYLESFFRAFDAIKGDTKLASPDIFANRNLSEEITFDMADGAVQSVLRTKVDESVESAFEVLRKRIDQFGVTQPNIQRVGNSGRIIVELPGAKDIERATALLQRTAQLEFWDAYVAQDYIQFFVQADNVLKEQAEASKKQDETTTSETEIAAIDAPETTQDSKVDDLLGEATADSTSVSEPSVVSPLLNLIKVGGQPGSPVIGSFALEDTAKVNSYLRKPEIKALLTPAQRDVKFLWGIPQINPLYKDTPRLANVELVDLYTVKGNRNNEPEINGSVVINAGQSFNLQNQPIVTMQMDTKGARQWEDMTSRAYNQGTTIAVVLDDIVYSSPGVNQAGGISGGNTEISGSFTLQEAQDLATVLRAGKLPAKSDVIRSSVVGPTLGKEAIDSGSKSFIIALALVLLWMIFYYGKAGVFSNVALLLNILLIFGSFSKELKICVSTFIPSRKYTYHRIHSRLRCYTLHKSLL